MDSRKTIKSIVKSPHREITQTIIITTTPNHHVSSRISDQGEGKFKQMLQATAIDLVQNTMTKIG